MDSHAIGQATLGKPEGIAEISKPVGEI